MATSPSRGRRARLRLRTLVRWLWYFETTPILPDETLLHSIPNNQDYFDNAMGAWAVSPTAFKPHPKRDPDGMSFFREDFTTPKRMVKRNRHPDGVRVARMHVFQLGQLNLHADPAPDDKELPGHVIVPELRYVKKQSTDERQNSKKLQVRLAQFATENGLYTPKKLTDPRPSIKR